MRNCEHGNCTFPVFGTDKNTGIGYCSSHQWCRTDKKVRKIPVRSKKQPSFDLSFGFESQVQLFGQLWENAKNSKGRVVCKFTDNEVHFYTTLEKFLCNFAHILPKGRFPYFKLNPDNIEIVDPEFHRIVDQGTQEDRAKHPDWRFDLWDAKVLEMKEKYQTFKKQNLLA